MSNIVMAGDAVYAGIDEGDVTEVKQAIVVQFDSKAEMREFIRNRPATMLFMDFDHCREERGDE